MFVYCRRRSMSNGVLFSHSLVKFPLINTLKFLKTSRCSLFDRLVHFSLLKTFVVFSLSSSGSRSSFAVSRRKRTLKRKGP